MLDNNKDLKSEKSILFLKWLCILLFSLYVLLDLGIYQKAVTNFHYLVLVIILVAIASEKFNSIKIGNLELKKFKEDINQKITEILNKIKQVQSQSQKMETHYHTHNHYYGKDYDKTDSLFSSSFPNSNLDKDFNSPSSFLKYRNANEDKKTSDNPNNLIYKHKFN